MIPCDFAGEPRQEAAGRFAPGGHTGDDDGDDDPLAADLAAYDALQEELDHGRTELAGDQATEPFADGDRVFWLEFPGFDPVLHGFDPANVLPVCASRTEA